MARADVAQLPVATSRSRSTSVVLRPSARWSTSDAACARPSAGEALDRVRAQSVAQLAHRTRLDPAPDDVAHRDADAAVGSGITSYQSPPTWAPAAPGR